MTVFYFHLATLHCEKDTMLKIRAELQSLENGPVWRKILDVSNLEVYFSKLTVLREWERY